MTDAACKYIDFLIEISRLTKLCLLLESLSNGDDTSHKKYSVQSPLSFRKIVEIERFALRRGGHLGRVSNLFRGRGGGGFSPPQRPLCVVGRLGRKKKRARGAR